MPRSFRPLAIVFFLAVAGQLSSPAVAQGRRAAVAVFQDLLTPAMRTVSARVESDLAAAGLRVTRCTADQLTAGVPGDVLVYPAGARYPAGSADSIRAFLKRGGRLLVLGGPAFTEPAWKQGAAWKTWEDLKAGLESSAASHRVVDFGKPEFRTGWERATNDENSPGSAAAGDFGGDHGPSLRIDMASLTGWDNWGHAVSGWPAGRNVLTFHARGDKNTGQILVELREKDGSRWMGVAPLAPEWRFVALSPDDFRFWPDSGAKGRGGPGDRVRFDRVRAIHLGLAFSHTPMQAGSHRLWVGSLAVQPDSRRAASQETRPLVLDSLTPTYKVFPVTNAASAASAASILLGPGRYPLPANPISVSPRPLGTGFRKGRAARFIPLIAARDSRGRRAGYVAWMQINAAGEYAGSAWAAFGANDAAFYRNAGVRRALVRTVRLMTDRPLLAEGGAAYYACLPTEGRIPVGARLAPGRPITGRTQIRITLTGRGMHAPRRVWKWDIDPARSAGEVSTVWTPSASERVFGTFTVRTELLLNGRVVDALSHPFTFWRPKPPAERAWVTAREGSFWLAGRRWASNGVNYMPSSGIALEDGEVFERWLGAKGYDPVIVEEDLSRIAALGFNSISVFLYRSSMEARNLFDLVLRAERHRLKVNLSLRPHADPFDFDWDEVRDMIAFYRLPECDTVFAYDLAWERGFGSYEPSYSNAKGRKFYDPQWQAWVIERYGSIENAEADWGFAIPRTTAGEVTGPSDEMLDVNGAWLRMVAAYRRFVDDLASRAYGRAARLLRSVDPRHLVGFRMNTAGDPTAPPHEFPFDFRGLGRALDIMEPEGYGRQGDWNRVRDGAFTVAYSRYAAPGRPVLWSEFGMSTWSGSNFPQPNPAQAAQASYFANFYHMAALSDSNGTAAWWFPGGYRVNENSDFGVLDPDGSDRPVTPVIRMWMPKLRKAAAQPLPRVDAWIDVDRDSDVRGLAGIYEKCKAEFWKALAAGMHPGLTDRSEGTTSANTPLIAVGGTVYNGKNPPRYLNGEFDRLEILAADGTWVDVSGGLIKGGEEITVDVAPGRLVNARAVAGNTQSATWLAPAPGRETGAVYLSTTPESQLQIPMDAPIAENTPQFGATEIGPFLLSTGIDRETGVVVQLTARNRAWFGEKIAFRLRPLAPPSTRP